MLAGIHQHIHLLARTEVRPDSDSDADGEAAAAVRTFCHVCKFLICAEKCINNC